MKIENNINLPLIEGSKLELNDDIELLDMMLLDLKIQPLLYHPGPYWMNRAKSSSNDIKKHGIAGFRGSTNLIGMSYADNMNKDYRNVHNFGFKGFASRIAKMYPLNKIFEAQVRWTEGYANESIIYAQELLNIQERTRNLLDKYTIPYSVLGECWRKVKIDGHDYSIDYLDKIEKHDNIASCINFNDAFSIFEIGPGFGANIHFLLENYSNIRKVLYLDIPPNLYVGTQYLKAFYGAKVFDYRNLKHAESIKFSNDDNLEILCIAPWQIEKFEGIIDIFMNTSSFVEMPSNVCKNYVDRFNVLPKSNDAAIALTTYDCFDLKITLHPSELPKYFRDRKFEYFEVNRLLDSYRKNLFFVSPGRFSF